MLHQCQAEDQGGWPLCKQPAIARNKEAEPDGRHFYYCAQHLNHRFNRSDNLEVLPPEDLPNHEVMFSETWTQEDHQAKTWGYSKKPENTDA